MLKYKMYLISIVGMCLLVGCGNNNIEQNDSEIQDSSTFAGYGGYWSYEGKTQEQIIAEGELNYPVLLQKIINFREHFFHSRK